MFGALIFACSDIVMGMALMLVGFSGGWISTFIRVIISLRITTHFVKGVRITGAVYLVSVAAGITAAIQFLGLLLGIGSLAII